MLFLPILAIVAVLTWWLFSPTARFLNGFANLVDWPRTNRSLLKSLSCRSSVTGRFRERAVTLEIVHPYENRIGEIVLSMEVRAPGGAPWKDSTLTSRNPDISRATFDLEGKYEWILAAGDGWLRASSRPIVLRFPGRFDPDKWRNSLSQMHVLADWLEKRASGSASGPAIDGRPR